MLSRPQKYLFGCDGNIIWNVLLALYPYTYMEFDSVCTLSQKSTHK